jgi:hypothetical protein
MTTWKARFEQKIQDQKDAERQKLVEVNDISFPSLSTESAWGGTGEGASGGAGTGAKKSEAPKKSFASLASEWKEDEEFRKYEAQMNAEKEKEWKSQSSGVSHIFQRHGVFGNSHSRTEDTYYEDMNEMDSIPPAIVPVTADTSDDWRVCTRKVRKAPRSAFEKAMMEQDHEHTDEQPFWEPPQEDSVWDKY